MPTVLPPRTIYIPKTYPPDEKEVSDLLSEMCHPSGVTCHALASTEAPACASGLVFQGFEEAAGSDENIVLFPTSTRLPPNMHPAKFHNIFLAAVDGFQKSESDLVVFGSKCRPRSPELCENAFLLTPKGATRALTYLEECDDIPTKVRKLCADGQLDCLFVEDPFSDLQEAVHFLKYVPASDLVPM
jgi:hypothetical protein